MLTVFLGQSPCPVSLFLGIDFLAAGIGNIHGKYPANWQGLNFEVLENVKKAVGDMPLVLHGGTGIPADMIKKAISLGVAKINVNTECQLSFAAHPLLSLPENLIFLSLKHQVVKKALS